MTEPKSENGILWGWKTIADHLDKDIKTLYRWEKELGLPVHRSDPDSLKSKVYAYKDELNDWLKSRNSNNNHSAPRRRSVLLSSKTLLILLVGVVVTTAIFIIYSTSLVKKTELIPQNKITLAIYEFELTGNATDQAFLTEGISIELKNRILLGGIIKIAPARQFYTERAAEENKFGREVELTTDYVLNGKISESSDFLEISIELVESDSHDVVLTKVFEDRIEKIPHLVEVIYQDIIRSVNLYPDNEYNTALEATNTKTYGMFLRGTYLLNSLESGKNDPISLFHKGEYFSKLSTEEANDLAIDLFSRSLEMDENFASSYIGLAQCYVNYVNYNWEFNEKWLDSAEELLKKAQEFHPNLPEYFSTLARVLIIKSVAFGQDKIDEAFVLINSGLNKYPNHYRLNLQKGYYYFMEFGKKGNVSDFEMASTHMNTAYSIDPFNSYNLVFTELLMLDENYLRAMEICKFIQSYDLSEMAKFRLGEIYYFMGDLDSSISIFEEFNYSLEHKAAAMFYLGMIAAQINDIDEAVRIAKHLSIISPGQYGWYWQMASIYYGIGREREGKKFLKLLFSQPESDINRHIYYRYIEIDKNFDVYMKNGVTSFIEGVLDD